MDINESYPINIRYNVLGLLYEVHYFIITDLFKIW